MAVSGLFTTSDPFNVKDTPPDVFMKARFASSFRLPFITVAADPKPHCLKMELGRHLGAHPSGAVRGGARRGGRDVAIRTAMALPLAAPGATTIPVHRTHFC
jgi:hypothetical protein